MMATNPYGAWSPTNPKSWAPQGTAMVNGQLQTPDGWSYHGGSWNGPTGVSTVPDWLKQGGRGQQVTDPATGKAMVGGTGGLGNPYLQPQADAIMGNLWQNYARNTAPQIASAAAGAGQYGSSRQGVLEANALRDLNTQGANALASLYGTAYESDANRNLQKYGIDTSANTALTTTGMNNAASKYASDNSLLGSKYSADTGLLGTKYGADASKYNAKLGYDASKYASDNSLLGSKYGTDASMANAKLGYDASKYASDNSLLGSKYGTDASMANAKLGYDASKYASDNSLIGSKYGADTSKANAITAADASKYAADSSSFVQRYLGDLQSKTSNRSIDVQSVLAGNTMLNSAVNNAMGIFKTLYDTGNKDALSQFENAIQPMLKSLFDAAGVTGVITTKKAGP